jgi:hypothetical protein
VDAAGVARPQIVPPGLSFDGLSFPVVDLASLDALPEGGMLVAGTVIQIGTPNEAIGGVWWLDANLAPVSTFGDRVHGVAGFAGETTAISSDTFGLDAVRRIDGSLLVMADLPVGATWVFLEFLADGQVRPGAVYPELGPGLRLAMASDDTVFTCASAGGVLYAHVSDTHVAGSYGIPVLGTDPLDRPSHCGVIAAAPARTAVFAGTHLERWVWGKIDAVPVLDAAFLHEWQPPGTSSDVTRIVRLPDGRWLLGGTYQVGGAPRWALLRVWD